MTFHWPRPLKIFCYIREIVLSSDLSLYKPAQWIFVIMTEIKIFCYCLIICKTIFEVSTEDIEFYPSRDNFNKIEKNSHVILQTEVRIYNNDVEDSQYTSSSFAKNKHNRVKRIIDPVFHGHPKTQEQLWEEHFLKKSKAFDQTPSLIKLLYNITLEYLHDCTPVILYDSHVQYEEANLLQNLFNNFPVTYAQGRINDADDIDEPKLLIPRFQCLHYIVFLADVKRCSKVIGMQSTSKVVVVARSSQWAVQEFLSVSLSTKFVNLLVIGQTFKDDDDTLVREITKSLAKNIL